jgi:hypothetical protein
MQIGAGGPGGLNVRADRTLTVAMVIALARFRIIAACVLGLFISLLLSLGRSGWFQLILVVGFTIPVFNRAAGLLTMVGEHVARGSHRGVLRRDHFNFLGMRRSSS